MHVETNSDKYFHAVKNYVVTRFFQTEDRVTWWTPSEAVLCGQHWSLDWPLHMQ